MINRKELLEENYDKSQEIDDTFARIRYEKGLREAVDYLIEVGAIKLDIDSYEILYYINEYTKNKYTQEEKEKKILDLKKKDKIIKNISFGINKDIKLNEVTIETIEETIKFMQLSDLKKDIKELFPEIDTDDRIKRCFSYAFEISKHLGKQNNVVTGYIYGYTDLSKYLHSWIELNYKGQDYVIDGTLNVMMNKDGYYALRHAKPLTKISNENILEDINKYSSIVDKINLPEYYLFRDKYLENLEKNVDINSDIHKK